MHLLCGYFYYLQEHFVNYQLGIINWGLRRIFIFLIWTVFCQISLEYGKESVETHNMAQAGPENP